MAPVSSAQFVTLLCDRAGYYVSCSKVFDADSEKSRKLASYVQKLSYEHADVLYLYDVGDEDYVSEHSLVVVTMSNRSKTLHIRCKVSTSAICNEYIHYAAQIRSLFLDVLTVLLYEADSIEFMLFYDSRLCRYKRIESNDVNVMYTRTCRVLKSLSKLLKN